MFETHTRLSNDSDVLQASQHCSRQSESSTRQSILFAPHLPTPLRRLTNSNRTAHGPANHLFRTTRPADVLPWVVDGDRQVVAASVLTDLGTRRASRYMIAADLPNIAERIRNS